MIDFQSDVHGSCLICLHRGLVAVDYLSTGRYNSFSENSIRDGHKATDLKRPRSRDIIDIESQ